MVVLVVVVGIVLVAQIWTSDIYYSAARRRTPRKFLPCFLLKMARTKHPLYLEKRVVTGI